MLSRFWTIPILAYHRVGEPKGDHVPTVTPENFQEQLEGIARSRYTVLDLSAVVERVAQGRPLERRSVVITFDDGYEETCTVAAPLLRRFGFRATVFVTPTEIGLPGFLTWEQLRTAGRDGLAVGSHTMHHAFLPLLSQDQVQHELTESKLTLERQLEHPVTLLSYPVGGYTPTIQDVARTSGYRAACTTNRGTARTVLDLFALRRIKMTDRDRHPLFLQAKLSGYYDLFRRLEPPA